MKKVVFTYVCIGVIMGLIILLVFLRTLPDGRTLRIVFCDVGQGDAAYIHFPNGNDMLIDGGLPGSVLPCLGKYMPSWDRKIDLVVMTHPELDHFGGLIAVGERYTIGTFLRTTISNTTTEYSALEKVLANKHVSIRMMTAGNSVKVGEVYLTWIWPTETFLALYQQLEAAGQEVNRNDTSQIIHLRYRNFDALFTGDAGMETQKEYIGMSLSPDSFELLKVPHHGSLTGLDEPFLNWLKPEIAVISVSKNNTYGHPRPEILKLLGDHGIQVYRTDQKGMIAIESDGIGYRVK